ncbi:RDD family protein [Apibacter sp. HY039]|uniref:RDD family protein n=1 Tax=Apibacter sp. HY039 TaxID=2501476 RepID=UPI000FEB694B|nr:RDD family protein [Apibacter sp. HY039]
MDNVHINTSQNVSIDYNLADIGNRIFGYILDAIFVMIYSVIIIVLFFSNTDMLEYGFFQDGEEFLLILLILLLLPAFTYALWAPYFMQGQTFGKKILKLKIIKADGSEAKFSTFLIRWLLSPVDTSFYCVIGLIVMSTNTRRQRVADLVAGTVVISTRQTYQVDQTILSQLEEDYQPKFTQVLQLSDKDMYLIKNTMDTARSTTDYQLVKKLREKIESVIQEYKPEMSDVEYVETVIKDYQFFSQQ